MAVDRLRTVDIAELGTLASNEPTMHVTSALAELVYYPRRMTTSRGTVDWEEFFILPRDLLVPPRDISREEAWRRHRERLRLSPGRLEILHRLCEANGVQLGERGTRDTDALEAWIRGLAGQSGSRLGDVESPIVSAALDAGTMFGDELIARYPTLSWQLKRGSPNNVFYHYTVIMGFSRARGGFDLEMSFTFLTELRQSLQGGTPRPWFPNLLESAGQWA